MPSDSDRVDILDTSSLVACKKIIGVANQWAAFKMLEERVVAGLIAMPRQVIREATEIAHPDLPGAWAPGVRGLLQHPLGVDYTYLSTVMAQAGDLIDPAGSADDADPYILALALQLSSGGQPVRVITEDRTDRPPIRISLCTACDRFGIENQGIRVLLEECGVRLKREATE